MPIRAPLSHSSDAWFALLGSWVSPVIGVAPPITRRVTSWLSQGVNSNLSSEETMRALLLGLLLAVMTAVPVFADGDDGALPTPTTTIEAVL